MTNAELLWRQMNYIVPLEEQTLHALEIVDCGPAVGRTPAGLPRNLSGTTIIGGRKYRTWGGYLIEEIVDTGIPATEEYQALMAGALA